MNNIVVIVHMLTALALIVLILVQHGKGADAGAAFGSGASSTVFGSRGSGSFLTRSTAILATVFFATSLFMGYLTISRDKASPIIPTGLPEQAQPAADQSPAGDLPPVEAPTSEAGPGGTAAAETSGADAAPSDAQALESESKGSVETQPAAQGVESDLNKIPD